MDVRFDRVDVERARRGRPGARSANEAELTPVQREEVPAHLSFARRIRLSSREVMLVTYDPDRQELMAVQDPPRGTR